MIDDRTLTNEGLELTGAGKILILACGALAREILALIEQNGWTHLDLKCLPAILHNTPDKITDRVVDAVHKNKAQYDQIFVAYADCGTGGTLEAACEELKVGMIAGPHCYSFFDGNEAFATRDEITAFYLTDFLVRQFDAFVTKPLGLDRHPQLRDMYFGNYEKLIYLAQTEDSALIEKAKSCAEALGLAFEMRATGYGDLENSIADIAVNPDAGPAS